MNRHRSLWFAAAFLIIALSGTIVTHSWETGKQHSAATISAAELQRMIDAGEKFKLVDVRTPNEYRTGHIAGSVLVPLDQIQAGSFPLDKHDKIVLYCHSGRRSGIALSILADRGYSDVRHLEGGILTWKSDLVRGGPVVGTPTPSAAN